MNTDPIPEDEQPQPPPATASKAEQSSDNGFFSTPDISSLIRQFHTEPANAAPTQSDEGAVGSTDHFATLSAGNQSSPDRKPAAVTKLQVTPDEGDDFFDSWGEDDIDVGDSDTNNGRSANTSTQQQKMDDSDSAAERMREESKRMAEQIMLHLLEKQKTTHPLIQPSLFQSQRQMQLLKVLKQANHVQFD